MNNDTLHRMLTLDKIERAKMQAEADAKHRANPNSDADDSVLSSLYHMLVGGGEDKAKDLSNVKNNGVVDPQQASERLRGLSGMRR
jgi:hypothetical protein